MTVQNTTQPAGCQTQQDSAFFALIHQVLEAERHRQVQPGIFGSITDQRKNRRREFNGRQRIAPFDGQNIPPNGDFRGVECHDISPCGFSFYSPTKFGDDKLIVAFGNEPYLFLQAAVMNCQWDAKQGRGWRVGCRFDARIDGSSLDEAPFPSTPLRGEF